MSVSCCGCLYRIKRNLFGNDEKGSAYRQRNIVLCYIDLYGYFVGLYYAAKHAYGVIAWFYPWYQKSLKRITGSGVLLSIIIEMEQIFIQRGTDIDDVILNTLGVLIGGTIAMLGSKYVWPLFRNRL